MIAPELEDALVDFIARNTSELRYRSNNETRQKVAPAVYAAFIPRNVVGEVIPGEITTYPAVIVRAKSGVQALTYERVTCEIIIGVYDNELNQQGSRDALQLVTRIAQRIREQGRIAQKFPIRMPLNWQVNKRAASGPTGDYNAYPYYFAEMQLDFELPIISDQATPATWMGDDIEQRYETIKSPSIRWEREGEYE